MDILYLLIPVSALLVLAIVVIFGWAVHAGQFDDLEREGERLLQPDPPPDRSLLDESQAGVIAVHQESPGVGAEVKSGERE